jgi:hypothetical protein
MEQLLLCKTGEICPHSDIFALISFAEMLAEVVNIKHDVREKSFAIVNLLPGNFSSRGFTGTMSSGMNLQWFRILSGQQLWCALVQGYHLKICRVVCIANEINVLCVYRRIHGRNKFRMMNSDREIA